jgi:Alpha/beta hydrolase family
VLIHSPLLGPTSWSLVLQELKRRGYQAVAPSLLGIGTAPPPQWRHVPEAVRRATTPIVSPVMLVGHSGAGPLLPLIAEGLTAEVVGLIFVDASLPPAYGVASLVPPEFMDHLRALAGDGVLPPWSSWFGEQTMEELVPSEPVRDALEAEMPRLPLSFFEAAVPMPQAWTRRPCAYLLLSDEAYGASAAHARKRGWPVAELPGAQHLSIITDPLAVTDVLLDLAHHLQPAS